MRYVADPVSQIDGSRYEQANCVAAGTAELIDIATVGRLRFKGSDVRRASGVTAGRGLFLTEVADAAIRLTGGTVVLDARYLEAGGTQRGRLQARVVGGQACGVVIHCAVTAETDFRTNWFRGLHFVTVAAYRWQAVEKPHAEYLVEDPGTTKAGWRWWPADLLYRAAEAAGGGGIWILAARDTEGVTRYGRETGNMRSKPTLQSGDIGNVRIGRAYTVVSTTRGGQWTRRDGTKAVGWHQIRKRSGRIAWLKGESLQ